MFFANPWGLLALLALPVIGAIHLFQRRFPPLLVAGAHLWGADVRVQTAGRRRDRLPVTPSLLLELLAALLFSLALAQPRFGDVGSVTHEVVVLDDSASMSAESSGSDSFRDRALSEVERLMSDTERDARITLIRTGRQPTLLGSRAMPWDQAQAALADWQPGSPRHDFGPAWDEATQITGREGQWLFLTDHTPADTFGLPDSMNVVSVGRPLANVAIAAARWLFDLETSSGQLYLRIANHGSDASRVRVSARQTGQPKSAAQGPLVFEQEFDVPPRGSIPLETTLPGGLGQIDIEISTPGDGLLFDNRVTLVEPQVRVLSVAVTLPDPSPERRLVQRVLAAVPNRQAAEPDKADLIIGPAAESPTPRPGLWWLGIGPINPSPVVRQQSRDLLGPFLIEKQHPLMEGVVLGGVVWGGVQPSDLDLLPLISAGARPLLGRVRNTQTTAFIMNIDLARSNIGESPDWPILLTNLCELCRDELPGLRRWNYQILENVRLRLEPPALPDSGSEVTTLTLQEPSGHERTIVQDRNGLVEITRLDHPGVYQIRQAGEVQGRFAVNFFDPEESDLSRLSPGRRESTVTAGSVSLELDDPYSWVMALAVLLLLAVVLSDWWILRPGQVAG